MANKNDVTLTLNVLQRTRLATLFETMQSNKRDSRIDLRIADKMLLSEEESPKCDFQKTTLGDRVSYSWNPAREFDTDIVLDAEEANRMRSALESWTGYTPLDLRTWLAVVLTQLGI
jgi:hypothetical protein